MSWANLGLFHSSFKSDLKLFHLGKGESHLMPVGHPIIAKPRGNEFKLPGSRFGRDIGKKLFHVRW